MREIWTSGQKKIIMYGVEILYSDMPEYPVGSHAGKARKFVKACGWQKQKKVKLYEGG